MKKVVISTDKSTGRIKPLHGVGGGPVTNIFTGDATKYFREAGIPFSRTHDIEYPFGAGEFVDIHCVFPDFRQDENDPSNYNFVMTDAYLQSIANAGTEVFYRLGSSIEHQPIKRYIMPPADFEKWARVCSHIIAHYNEGWGNGYHMGIRYWEMWNEPDLENRCWTGTYEQMFELYDITARIVKSEHPDVKFGGLAFTSPAAPMADAWLAHLKKSGAPVDFFSWHGYIHTPEEVKALTDQAEALLAKHGFGHLESIYDEWNYVVNWTDKCTASIKMHKSALCAALNAAVLSELQASRTDLAMYYDVQVDVMAWNGFFTRLPMKAHGEPVGIAAERPYYAFYAWNKLYRLGNAVSAVCEGGNLYASAACADGKLRAIVSHYNDDAGLGGSKPAPETVVFSTPAFGAARAFVCDDTHVYDETPFDGRSLLMDGNSFALLEWDL